MKSRIEQWRFLRFVPVICCAVSLSFSPVMAGSAFGGQNDARLDTADLARLEPPLTLEALIERIGVIARRGLSGSEDIYTEPVLARLFGVNTILDVTALDNTPGAAGARRRHEVRFFARYTLPYASGDRLPNQGAKIEIRGTWIQYQYGNTRLTLQFFFPPGGPDRSRLETMLGIKLVQVNPLQPLPPGPVDGPFLPATSPDGYSEFRADTQANLLAGSISIDLGRDGRVDRIVVVQDDLDQPAK